MMESQATTSARPRRLQGSGTLIHELFCVAIVSKDMNDYDVPAEDLRI